MARGTLATDDPAYNHVMECSPCYEELMTLTEQVQSRRSGRRWRVPAAALVAGDKESAQTLFRRAIRHGAPPPRVINTDLAPTYLTAIAGLQRSATCRAIAGTGPCSTSIHRGARSPVCEEAYCCEAGLQGIRIRAAVDGYEAIHRMRKGQVRWLPARDIVRHNLYIDRLFGLVR